MNDDTKPSAGMPSLRRTKRRPHRRVMLDDGCLPGSLFRHIGRTMLAYVDEMDPGHEFISRVRLGDDHKPLTIQSGRSGAKMTFIWQETRMTSDDRIEGWIYVPQTPTDKVLRLMITNC